MVFLAPGALVILVGITDFFLYRRVGLYFKAEADDAPARAGDLDLKKCAAFFFVQGFFRNFLHTAANSRAAFLLSLLLCGYWLFLTTLLWFFSHSLCKLCGKLHGNGQQTLYEWSVQKRERIVYDFA